MEGTEVLKFGRNLWIMRFSIAISPLFFFVLFSNIEKYSLANQKIATILSPYHTIIFISVLLSMLWVIYHGYKLYRQNTNLNQEGISLTDEQVRNRAYTLKLDFLTLLKAASFSIVTVTVLYISEPSNYITLIFVLPSIMAYVYAFKYSYLFMVKQS